MAEEQAEVKPYSWRVIGASVQGAAHLRSGQPNQDALRWWPRTGGGPPLVLTVADGHGGRRYVRSHIGARYAVRTVEHLLARDLLSLLPPADDSLDFSSLKRTCEEWLPKVLVRRWRQQVERHASRYPLTDAERLLFDGEQKEPPLVEAYGATVMAVLCAATFHLYLQLGDGDILTVTDEGAVFRPPLPVDERLIGNETTSLCSSEGWRNVRFYFQPLVGAPPAMLLLATDGYANSFVDGAAFEQVGADLLHMIRSEGAAAVEQQLPGWLEQTSTSGSGDDITIALAIRGGENRTAS
jgi:serine/threonine protein phosphatase PrpC